MPKLRESVQRATQRPDHGELVERLSDWMQVKLDANIDKGSWRTMTTDQLMLLLFAEVMELGMAVKAGEDPWSEAGDVAAYAAMVADVAERQKGVDMNG